MLRLRRKSQRKLKFSDKVHEISLRSEQIHEIASEDANIIASEREFHPEIIRQNGRSDKSSYCRPIMSLNMEQLVHNVEEKDKKVRQIVQKIVQAREKAKRSEDWTTNLELPRTESEGLSTKYGCYNQNYSTNVIVCPMESCAYTSRNCLASQRVYDKNPYSYPMSSYGRLLVLQKQWLQHKGEYPAFECKHGKRHYPVPNFIYAQPSDTDARKSECFFDEYNYKSAQEQSIPQTTKYSVFDDHRLGEAYNRLVYKRKRNRSSSNVFNNISAQTSSPNLAAKRFKYGETINKATSDTINSIEKTNKYIKIVQADKAIQEKIPENKPAAIDAAVQEVFPESMTFLLNYLKVHKETQDDNQGVSDNLQESGRQLKEIDNISKENEFGNASTLCKYNAPLSRSNLTVDESVKISKNYECNKEPKEERMQKSKQHSLSSIESKLDHVIKVMNKLLDDLETKRKSCYKENNSGDCKINNNNIINNVPDYHSINTANNGNINTAYQDKKILGNEKVHSTSKSVSQSHNLVDRSVSNLDRILIEERNKSNKAKNDISEMLNKQLYRPFGVQISLDVPTKDRATEVNAHISKGNTTSDIKSVSRDITVATVNTDHVALLDLLKLVESPITNLLPLMTLDDLSCIPQYIQLTEDTGEPQASTSAQTSKQISLTGKYSCNFCKATFSGPADVNAHIKKSHYLVRGRNCCICRHLMEHCQRNVT